MSLSIFQSWAISGSFTCWRWRSHFKPCDFEIVHQPIKALVAPSVADFRGTSSWVTIWVAVAAGGELQQLEGVVTSTFCKLHDGSHKLLPGKLMQPGHTGFTSSSSSSYLVCVLCVSYIPESESWVAESWQIQWLCLQKKPYFPSCLRMFLHAALRFLESKIEATKPLECTCLIHACSINHFAIWASQASCSPKCASPAFLRCSSPEHLDDCPSLRISEHWHVTTFVCRLVIVYVVV